MKEPSEIPLKLDYATASRASKPRQYLLLLCSYALVTFILIQFLEPGLTPPGFTGKGFTAMPLLLFGAIHASRHRARRVLLFGYGCLGAMLLVPSYLDNRRGMALAADDLGVAKATFIWVAFSLLVGVSCVVAAKVAAACARTETDAGRNVERGGK